MGDIEIGVLVPHVGSGVPHVPCVGDIDQSGLPVSNSEIRQAEVARL
jgi:hypothetical protein